MTNHSGGNRIVAFKNGCAPDLKATFTITLKNSDWVEAKKTLYADSEKEKFTPLDEGSCKDAPDRPGH